MTHLRLLSVALLLAWTPSSQAAQDPFKLAIERAQAACSKAYPSQDAEGVNRRAMCDEGVRAAVLSAPQLSPKDGKIEHRFFDKRLRAQILWRCGELKGYEPYCERGAQELVNQLLFERKIVCKYVKLEYVCDLRRLQD
jgi:hypothetical protein